MYCNYCGRENDTDALYCVFCGKQIYRHISDYDSLHSDLKKRIEASTSGKACQICGTPNLVTSSYCTKCGGPLK